MKKKIVSYLIYTSQGKSMILPRANNVSLLADALIAPTLANERSLARVGAIRASAR